MTGTCDYCGSAEVFAWQGKAQWCGSDRCGQRHEWATCEPNFLMPTPWPTLWSRAVGLIQWAAFTPLTKAVPSPWLLEPRGWRQSLSVAVWARAWQSYDQMKGTA